MSQQKAEAQDACKIADIISFWRMVKPDAIIGIVIGQRGLNVVTSAGPYRLRVERDLKNSTLEFVDFHGNVTELMTVDKKDDAELCSKLSEFGDYLSSSVTGHTNLQSILSVVKSGALGVAAFSLFLGALALFSIDDSPRDNGYQEYAPTHFPHMATDDKLFPPMPPSFDPKVGSFTPPTVAPEMSENPSKPMSSTPGGFFRPKANVPYPDLSDPSVPRVHRPSEPKSKPYTIDNAWTPPPGPLLEAPATPQPSITSQPTSEALPGPMSQQDEPMNDPSDVASMPPLSLDVEGAEKLLLRLKEIRQTADAGEEVTPQMLEGLPSQFAERLKQKQLYEQPISARATVKPRESQRLTDEDMKAAAKDRYGIPNIPPANTWASTNGRVVIPLPGSGDIRSVEDFKSFGIQLD
ncbi:hypothetical protein ACFOY8_14590 [Thalassospira xianhensis]|uniref:Uncharacterized protein n=1 Tax=Thalassospira xianhensis MCCC 1A02616 TaxID=1177929 RepID=A0A367UHH8_9PROT|nr:hypothetical protein [Thalassospira xianhensis]RCK07619.1 hypothetical protein TH5_00650 [Thalassospira xianhensis MCCC 1A02616]